MKKPDVVKAVAEVSGLTQGDASRSIKALVKVIQEALKALITQGQGMLRLLTVL